MVQIDLKLRHAEGKDLIELQQLFVDTVSGVCSKDYSEEQINVWILSIKNTELWIDKIQNQFFIIAEISDKIVGFGTLENGNYIDLLYVHKDYQRQGIADKLYCELEKEAIRQNKITLTAHVSMTAVPFFEKKGFIKTSEQTKIIQGVKISNYKMTKELRKE